MIFPQRRRVAESFYHTDLLTSNDVRGNVSGVSREPIRVASLFSAPLRLCGR